MKALLNQLKALAANRALKRTVKWTIAAAVLFGFGRRLYLEREKLAVYDLDVMALPLFGSGLCYLLGLGTFAAVWRLALVDQKCTVRGADYLPAYYISQLGKYIPGKAFVVVLRHEWLKRSPVGLAKTALTTIQENLLTMVVGALVAAGLLLFIDTAWRGPFLAGASAIGIGFGMFCLPPVVHVFVKIFLPGKVEIREGEELPDMHRPSWLHFIYSCLFAIGGWVFFAISLNFAVQAISPVAVEMQQWPTLLLAISLATVGGFFSFLPSGLGAREWILIETLSPLLAAEAAIATAILLRLVWMLAEGLAGCALGGRKLFRRAA